MFRFFYFTKYFIVFFLSQGIAFSSAKQATGDALVEQPKRLSPMRRCRSTNDIPSALVIEPSAATNLSGYSCNVKDAAEEPNVEQPTVLHAGIGAFSYSNFSSGSATIDVNAIIFAIGLLNNSSQSLNQRFALLILIVLSQNFIPDNAYIEFMNSVPASKRIEVGKAINIDWMITKVERKIEDLKSREGASCHYLLGKYLYNWKTPLNLKYQGHLGIAIGVREISAGPTEDLIKCFQGKSTLVVDKSVDHDSVKMFKQELDTAIATDQSTKNELNQQEDFLNQLKKFTVAKDPFRYSHLACD